MNNLGNKEIMANNIRYYMSINGLRATDVCKTLNIPMATFSDWIHARTYPRIDKIELMANYFGISKSDLVEYRHSIILDAFSGQTPQYMNNNCSVSYVAEDRNYYLNDKTKEIAQSIYENKELSLLFDAAKDAPPEDLEMVHSMLLALKRKEKGNE